MTELAATAVPARSPAWRRIRFVVLLALGVGAYALCLRIAEVDPVRFVEGLPRLAAWLRRAWPPDFSELDVLLLRAAETLAMATVGTSLAALVAVPLCLVASRSLMPEGWIYHPARLVLDGLRGIDSFVFALIFVAAVGLGPFAGVLGLAVHGAGTIAKLWSEAIEAAPPEPLDAMRMTGAGRLKVAAWGLFPDVMPSLASSLLYVWEFNLRASTVLGVVGAGGIGQELKNSVDLLAFPRLLTILVIVLVMVTAVDRVSAALRARLL